MADLVTGFGVGVATFVHVLKSGLRSAAVRALLWRTVVPQIATTLSLAGLIALLLPRIPMLTLDDNLLPRVVFETNRVTVLLCAAFVVEWGAARLWPARTAALLVNLAAAAGLADVPHVAPALAEARARARSLAPLLAACAVWTALLAGAAWVGLAALETRASDPIRLAATALAGAGLVILPAVPLLGTYAWFIADRLSRVGPCALGSKRPGAGVGERALLGTHPGEVLGLALLLLPGSLPLSYLVWRPFALVALELLQRTRIGKTARLPSELAADPIADLRDQALVGFALLRNGTLEPPPRAGFVVTLLWAPAIVSAVVRAVWRDPVAGRHARVVMAVQLLATFGLGFAWISLFGFDVDEHVTPLGGGTMRISFGATLAAAVFSILHVVQGIVIVASREHHERISADASRLVGVPPDEDVPDPRVRLDRAWLWRRLKRRAQGGVILFASALPWVLVVLILTVPVLKLLEDAVLVGWLLAVAVSAAANAVLLAFALYWGAVFLLGKTDHAWKRATDREPFFMEALQRVVDRHPRATWPIAVYLWMVRRTLGIVPRPAALMERMPVEAVGLALVRLACFIPGVSIVLRPFLPVGAALLLKHRAPECLDPVNAIQVPESETNYSMSDKHAPAP